MSAGGTLTNRGVGSGRDKLRANRTPGTTYTTLFVLFLAGSLDVAFLMEKAASNEHSSPSTIRLVLGFIVVGIAWGLTTPFMRRAAVGHKSPTRPFLKDESVSWLWRKALSLWYAVTDLLRRPSYSVPLLLNLSGSLWFFLIVGQAGKPKIITVSLRDIHMENMLTFG